MNKPRNWKNNKKFLKGIAASPGVISGIAYVNTSYKDDPKKIPLGSILVTDISSPDIIIIIDRIIGVVTNFGGKTSHISIIAREFGIPCVTDTIEATNLIKTGSEIIVNGNKGMVEYIAIDDVKTSPFK